MFLPNLMLILFAMKKCNILFLIMLLAISSLAQDIHLNFIPGNSEETIDSIIVLNQGSGQRLKLSGTETLVLKNIPTSISVMSIPEGSQLLYPNPAYGSAFVNYVNTEEGKVELKLYGASGILLGSYIQTLQQGIHRFRVAFPDNGFYIIRIIRGNEVKTLKAINLGEKYQDFRMDYLGVTANVPDYTLTTKAYNGEFLMDYRKGDILQFTLYSDEKITVMTDSPNTGKEMVVDFYKCTDLDNRNYKTVKIGDQVWMAENLAYLPSVSPGQTISATEPHYYVYDYDGTDLEAARQNPHYQTYGVLYNWTAALTACPEGWHLPSNDEWNELELTLGMTPAMIDRYFWRGTDQGTRLKNSSGWNNNGNGTNEVGFSALPGGSLWNDQFRDVGSGAYIWSSSEANNTIAWERGLAHGMSGVWRNGGGKVNGFSVRCVKDDQRPSVNTMIPTEITTTSAKSGGEISGLNDAQILEKGLVWGKSDLPTISQYDGKIIDKSAENTFISVLEGLSPGTVYYVRAYVVYDKGVVYGNQQGFATSVIFTPITYGQLTDNRGGETKVYKTVKIGDQTWMAENLAYLPSVSPSSEGSDTEPYYYVYDYQGTDTEAAKQHANYKTYGVLYNWPAAMAGAAGSTNQSQVQGVCPEGWHLPGDEEWSELQNYLINNGYNFDGSTSGNKMGKSLAATTHWESISSISTIGAIGNNLSANNKSGFSALPGGNRYHGNKAFQGVGVVGAWWNSTEINSSTPWYWQMVYSNVGVYRTDDARKSNGLSVRCVKDN
jgi:uncharacterized protein (TIGR02145 family)